MLKILRDWDSLPEFSKTLFTSTYFLPSEDYDGWIDRVTSNFCHDKSHTERMKIYLKNRWFIPSTPISSNAGTENLPVACYTGTVEDTKKGIFDSYNEANWLAVYGGGLGYDWSSVRELGHKVGISGKSSGVIPFLGMSNAAVTAISQGGTRRASQAVYMDISHPEIKEFIDLRKTTGDQSRRCHELHHAVVIPDSFMEAVINGDSWNLISPKSKLPVQQTDARELWFSILERRAQNRGEPYIMWSGTVNDAKPKAYDLEGHNITTSNLCSEILQRTDEDHNGVCVLGSINVEYWDEFEPIIDQFIIDCCDLLDNVVQNFIDRTEGLDGFRRARNGAIDERNTGLGVLGFHSLLQSKMIPFESAIAQGFNKKIFKTIRDLADFASINSDKVCPMAERLGLKERNIFKMAVAPTMSISTLAGVSSSGIEPWAMNAYTKSVAQGSFPIRNKYLDELLDLYVVSHNINKDEVWRSILLNEGSVQHLEFLTQWQKEVFKTAFEMDQSWIIQHASDRTPYIDQGQSLNIFISGNSTTQYISDIHMKAWKSKVKTLYYLRSKVTTRGGGDTDRKHIEVLTEDTCKGCS